MMQKQKYRKKKPNGRSVNVVVIDLQRDEHGRKTINLIPGRIVINSLFQGLDLTPSAKVKNLRHLRNFDPRAKITVEVRGGSPMCVPLNRVRIDPNNEMGEHPHLHVIGYGTLLARPHQQPTITTAPDVA